jgi:hypothetical protein
MGCGLPVPAEELERLPVFVPPVPFPNETSVPSPLESHKLAPSPDSLSKPPPDSAQDPLPPDSSKEPPEDLPDSLKNPANSSQNPANPSKNPTSGSANDSPEDLRGSREDLENPANGNRDKSVNSRRHASQRSGSPPDLSSIDSPVPIPKAPVNIPSDDIPFKRPAVRVQRSLTLTGKTAPPTLAELELDEPDVPSHYRHTLPDGDVSLNVDDSPLLDEEVGGGGGEVGAAERAEVPAAEAEPEVEEELELDLPEDYVFPDPIPGEFVAERFAGIGVIPDHFTRVKDVKYAFSDDE